MNPVTRKEPLWGLKTDEMVVTARLTGGGAATSLVNADSALLGAGEIVSATYVSTGLFTVVLRRAFVELKARPMFGIGGTTAGLICNCTAIDVTAKTATFKFYVGSTLTDPATTDFIDVLWVVRDSGKNA